MGETDLVPPMPPTTTEPEQKKEKKGFLKKVFSKKKEEELDIPIPEATEKKEEKEEVKAEKKDSSSDIDEISKLIDDTINDIQKLQGKETPKSQPKEEVKPKEVDEPPKIENNLKHLIDEEPKKEVIEVKKTKPAEKKTVKKTTKKVSKPVKKALVKKPAKKTVKKTTMKFDLPGFTPSKPVSKPKNKLEALEQELNEAKNGVIAKNPFHLETGETLHSLEDLKKALAKMSDNTWQHHVTASKNDFAKWIKLELKNPELAKKFATFLMKGDAINSLNSMKVKAKPEKTREIQKSLDFEKKMLSEPKEFFKLNNKIINDVKDLEKSVIKLSQKEYSTYVTRNKEAFQKWLAFLTKGYQKEAKDIHKKYESLLTRVLADVNSQIDKKIKASKSELTKNNAQLRKIKSEVAKLNKNKSSMITEQKALTENKTRLMAEVAKVKKEHQQVHALKEKTRLEKEELYKDITRNKEALKQEKADHKAAIAEAKAVAKKELSALSKQAKELEAKIKSEETKIKKEWDLLKAKQVEISKRDQESKKRENAVTKREDDFEAEKLRIENLVKNFEDREKQIELQKSELEVAGFQKYLDSKLKELHTPEVVDSAFDKGAEETRILLNNADVDAAKKKYLELKAEFESSNLTGSEKERIFNLLRELYDDIMLASQ